MKKYFLFLLGISFILMSFSSNSELQYGHSNMTETTDFSEGSPENVRWVRAAARVVVAGARYTAEVVRVNSPGLRYTALTVTTIIMMNEDIVSKEDQKNRKIFDLG